jgi:NAD(P)-dependent dehydrogenase (short-subunit alcohol dehydrogenase family)
MSTLRFSGKAVIVTGAASGIGLAIATRFAGEGAGVMIADLDQAKSAAAAADLAAKTGATVVGQACDVAEEDQVATCVEATIARFGAFDIVVNNAGLMTFNPLSVWTNADWLKVLHVDLLGAAMFTKQMFLHVGPNGGAIVNISSIHAIQTEADAAPYSAAKAALLSLTRTSSIEGRPKKIRANAILPGAINTPMLWDNPNVKSGVEKIDKADVGQPEDIAAVAAFLASDDARFVTGASLPVDGGRLARL